MAALELNARTALDTSLTLNLEILGQHSGLEAKLLILL